MKEFALKVLGTRGALIVDTETTGLGNRDEIVQLSIIDMTGQVVFDHLIRPGRAMIGAGAARVHGITHDMVRELPTLDEYYEELRKLTGRLVVAFNADFDKRMLMQSAVNTESNDLGLLFESWAWRCAMKEYAKYWGQWNRRRHSYQFQSLTTACHQQGVKVRNAHNSLGDVQMTLALLRKIAGVS